MVATILEMQIPSFAAAVALSLLMAAPGHAFEYEVGATRSESAADGVAYRKYVLNTDRGTMYLHTVSISPESGHTLMPVIANDRLNTVAPVTKLAGKVGAVAAINGGFFDTGKTRLPVGLVKIKRRIIFEQFLNRAVLGIDEHGQLHFDRFVLHSHLYVPSQDENTIIHGYNRKRKDSELIIYTPEFGPTTRTNEWGVELIMHRISPDTLDEPFILLEPDRYVVTGVNRCDSTIPLDGVVLSIHQPAIYEMEWLRNVTLGAEVQLQSNVPAGWESYPYLLGGGPLLLKHNANVLDPNLEGFGRYFDRPTARTAVGRKSDGTSLIVVVDSTGGAGGARWEELAILMQKMLGCVDAMGFDGGGSSTIYVGDQIANAPAGGGQRQVANILAVVPFDKFI